MVRSPSGRILRSATGASRAGCLLLVALGLVAVHVGIVFLGAELDYRSIRGEASRQAARAVDQNDEDIRAALVARADALGLPPSASDITIQRRLGSVISIRFGYADTLTFAGRFDWLRRRQIVLEERF